MPVALGPEVFLASLAAIILEIAYTRVFSYKLFYYFTYLVIGLALLGTGTGGVLVAFVPRFRRASVRTLVAGCCLTAALGTAVGYLVVAWTQCNAFDLVQALGRGTVDVAALEAAKLALVCIALFVPFVAVGVLLATAFATQTERIRSLYAADLIGAGIGCAVSVPLMWWVGPPGTIVLAGLLLGVAGVRTARAADRRLALALVTTCVVLGAGVLGAERLPDPVTDRQKSMSPQNEPRIRYSRWNPVFRVDVVESHIANDVGLLLAHDGLWGSVLPRYDGDPAALTRYDTNERALPFSLLPSGPRVAIIGAAGGNEILASLHFDAAHVTGVELNPVTVSLLTTEFRDFTGRLADDPRVTLVNAEGRAFFESTAERFDLVWFVAPDSYAAMNAATSGAFVLSESYLYTAEMVAASLERLTTDGIVCAQFGEPSYERHPNRTARYVATAREAFRRLGIRDFGRHVVVATSPGLAFTLSTVVLRRTPFTEADVARFAARVDGITDGRLRFPLPGPPDMHQVTRVASLSDDELEGWFGSQPFDLRPVTDDAPFFWHFVPFASAWSSETSGATAMAMTEQGMGERLLVVLLVVVTAFAGVFLVLPLALQRAHWRHVPYKGRAAVFFAAIGMGFMFLEVTLIQRLTLFLGYPTYSLTVTLLALLVFTGVGSLASPAAGADRGRALRRLGGLLAGLVIFYLVGLGPLLASLAGSSFAVRVGVTVALLAPLGWCLGAFMPLGLRTVSALTPRAGAYIAWAWAVNGSCSVVSSVLATLLSMAWGFTAVMATALGLYAVAIAAIASIPDAPVDLAAQDDARRAVA